MSSSSVPTSGYFVSSPAVAAVRLYRNPFCFAVIPRPFEGVSVWSKQLPVNCKQLLSSNKGKEPLRSMSNKRKSKLSVIKENVVKSELVGLQGSADGPEKAEEMTVQELRSKLRSVGLPTKGCKRDLVLAFKCFLENKIAGNNSQISNEQVSSGMAPTCASNTSLEKSGFQRAKKKAKQDNVKTNNVNNTADGNRTSSVKSKISEGDGPANIIDSFMHQTEPWAVLAHKKPQKDWIPYNPRIMRPIPLAGNKESVKLMSWNVNGLRALLKSEASSALQLAQREEFDVLCLQETKLQGKDVEAIKKKLIDGYDNSFWTCSESKLGYSGTAIISRIKPLSVRYGLGIADHDGEGRLITVEFDTFYLLSAYVPNSGDGLKRLSYRVKEWDPSLSSYMKELEKLKPVILTGDLNCAYEEIDIFDPAGNKKSAGFTNEERESFGSQFLAKGFVDTFRKQHPGVVGYTYWGYRFGARKTNKGWRLDYFLVSESIADKVYDSYILPDVAGSDHCPVGLVLKL